MRIINELQNPNSLSLYDVVLMLRSMVTRVGTIDGLPEVIALANASNRRIEELQDITWTTDPAKGPLTQDNSSQSFDPKRARTRRPVKQVFISRQDIEVSMLVQTALVRYMEQLRGEIGNYSTQGADELIKVAQGWGAVATTYAITAKHLQKLGLGNAGLTLKDNSSSLQLMVRRVAEMRKHLLSDEVRQGLLSEERFEYVKAVIVLSEAWLALRSLSPKMTAKKFNAAYRFLAKQNDRMSRELLRHSRSNDPESTAARFVSRMIGVAEIRTDVMNRFPGGILPIDIAEERKALHSGIDRLIATLLIPNTLHRELAPEDSLQFASQLLDVIEQRLMLIRRQNDVTPAQATAERRVVLSQLDTAADELLHPDVKKQINLDATVKWLNGFARFSDRRVRAEQNHATAEAPTTAVAVSEIIDGVMLRVFGENPIGAAGTQDILAGSLQKLMNARPALRPLAESPNALLSPVSTAAAASGLRELRLAVQLSNLFRVAAGQDTNPAMAKSNSELAAGHIQGLVAISTTRAGIAFKDPEANGKSLQTSSEIFHFFDRYLSVVRRMKDILTRMRKINFGAGELDLYIQAKKMIQPHLALESHVVSTQGFILDHFSHHRTHPVVIEFTNTTRRKYYLPNDPNYSIVQKFLPPETDSVGAPRLATGSARRRMRAARRSGLVQG